MMPLRLQVNQNLIIAMMMVKTFGTYLIYFYDDDDDDDDDDVFL